MELNFDIFQEITFLLNIEEMQYDFLTISKQIKFQDTQNILAKLFRRFPFVVCPFVSYVYGPARSGFC